MHLADILEPRPRKDVPAIYQRGAGLDTTP